MTEADILAHLNRWQSAMLECETRMDELRALLGCFPEEPLPSAIGRVMGAYTETVADLLGWDEQFLTAWWLEHNFGERPMRIGFPGEPMRSIDSVEALASFVAEDLLRSAK